MVCWLVLVGGALAGTRAGPEVVPLPAEAAGITVLWPRRSPDRSDPVSRAAAWQVQQRLADLARRSGRAAVVAPEPQRVCPVEGCPSPSLGAVVLRAGRSCAVVALVGEPGQGGTHLVPWVGQVELTSARVPFREPPESSVSVRDYWPCDALREPLINGQAQVEAALKQVLDAPSLPAPAAGP